MRHVRVVFVLYLLVILVGIGVCTYLGLAGR
jgi:hypothetical protein